MKVIGISGPAGAGKDTAFRLLSDELATYGLKTTQLSFAGKLKDLCADLFQWDLPRLQHDPVYKEGSTLDDGSPDPACEMLGMSRREAMQKVGTEAMRRGLHEDVWLISLKLSILRGDYDDFDFGIVTDCRFLNELQFVEDLGGITLQIVRAGETTLTQHTQHASEQEWRKWDRWSAVVLNPFDSNESEMFNLRNFRLNLRDELIHLIVENDEENKNV